MLRLSSLLLLGAAVVLFASSEVQGQFFDSEGLCPSEGFFRDPEACNKFFRCVALGNNYQLFRFDCPAGTVFDETVSVCNFPWAAPPCDAVDGETTTEGSYVTTDAPVDGGEGTGDGGEGDKDDGEDTFVVVAPQFSFRCSAPGFFEHDSNCSKFWLCRQPDGVNQLTPSLFKCPDNYLYDTSKRRCLPESEVTCNKTPDLARSKYDPVTTQLRLGDLPAFYAQFALYL